MASFRNHRVVIASLFLPTTAVLGESRPHTPEQGDESDAGLSSPQLSPETFPAVAQRLADAGIFNSHSRQPSLNVPLKSIVDDLKDKVSFSASFISYLILRESPYRPGSQLLPQDHQPMRSPTRLQSSPASLSIQSSLPLRLNLDAIRPPILTLKLPLVSVGKAVLSLVEVPQSMTLPLCPGISHGTWSPIHTVTVA